VTYAAIGIADQQKRIIPVQGRKRRYTAFRQIVSIFRQNNILKRIHKQKIWPAKLTNFAVVKQ
jgi:hypothetical protein